MRTRGAYLRAWTEHGRLSQILALPRNLNDHDNFKGGDEKLKEGANGEEGEGQGKSERESWKAAFSLEWTGKVMGVVSLRNAIIQSL